ncbi:MAG: TRAP transporter substrate-binding protein [Alphaproteobacteria bacterium]|jgi:TRAP-type C4-dicarboxylate transport system substrate-binding protein|nr:TRAP transporter substrate-binding protein [Alphaproteobacteria bacterium]|tara:strand:- start:1640 stop:2653 length:1014 start_codon:yes stop_codon:yes gene_type:complete
MSKLIIIILFFIIPIKSYAETTLRMASWLPPQHPWVLDIMVPWIEKVKVATEGRVRIELLSAPIGPPPAHFNFAVKGIADITYGVHNYTTGRFSSTQIAELPFLSNSSEVLSVAWQRIYERELLHLDEHKGTHLLGVFTHGPGQLWFNKKYESLDNIKGLKVRIGGGIAQSSSKALGLVPLQAPVTKAYELLSGGVADGIQLPSESISFFKLDRIIKQGFIFDGGLYNVSMFLVMNKKKWNKLSQDDQKAINSVSGEALAKMAGKAWDKADDKGIDASLKNGIILKKLSEDDKIIVTQLLTPIIENTLEKISKQKNIDAKNIYLKLLNEINLLKKEY